MAANAKTDNAADSKDENSATSTAEAAGVDAITPGSAGTTAGSNAFAMPADGLPAAAIAAGAAGAAVAAGELKKDGRQADQKAAASFKKAAPARKAAAPQGRCPKEFCQLFKMQGCCPPEEHCTQEVHSQELQPQGCSEKQDYGTQEDHCKQEHPLHKERKKVACSCPDRAASRSQI